ncbi:unnamed protein product [Caenorhabditis brenneri]
MTFPLLRLPLLASTKIVKYIDIEKIITLIQLSTRARTLVKLSRMQIKLTVLQHSIQFQKITGEEMVSKFNFFTLSAKPTDIPFNPSKIDTRIQHEIGAYKKVLDDFVEFFKVCSVFFELESARSYTFFHFMKPAYDLGLSIARVVIGEFIENTRFTVNHMCALVNCSEVSVRYLNWSNEGMNRFLKCWITYNGRLKSLVSRKGNWQNRDDVRVVMNGIDHREIRDKTFEIQRADGVKAKLEFYPTGFSLSVIDV